MSATNEWLAISNTATLFENGSTRKSLPCAEVAPGVAATAITPFRPVIGNTVAFPEGRSIIGTVPMNPDTTTARAGMPSAAGRNTESKAPNCACACAKVREAAAGAIERDCRPVSFKLVVVVSCSGAGASEAEAGVAVHPPTARTRAAATATVRTNR